MWPLLWLSDCRLLALLMNWLIFPICYVCLFSWELLHSQSFWVLITWTWSYLAWSYPTMFSFQLPYITTQFRFLRENHIRLYWLRHFFPTLYVILVSFGQEPDWLYSNQLWPSWCIMVHVATLCYSFLRSFENRFQGSVRVLNDIANRSSVNLHLAELTLQPWSISVAWHNEIYILPCNLICAHVRLCVCISKGLRCKSYP